MHSFNLTRHPARVLLARLGLQRAKVLGRGSFSAVFAHPDVSRDSVLKITTDKAGYAYLDEGARVYGLSDSIYFPKVLDTLEDLNEELIDSGSEFRVIEMERLTKGRVPQLERRLLHVYAARAYPGLTPRPISEEDETWAEKMKLKHPQVCSEVNAFAQLLAKFCTDWHFRIDQLGSGNSMLRGSQLVFNDPVFCMDAMNAVESKYRNARRARNAHLYH